VREREVVEAGPLRRVVRGHLTRAAPAWRHPHPGKCHSSCARALRSPFHYRSPRCAWRRKPKSSRLLPLPQLPNAPAAALPEAWAAPQSCPSRPLPWPAVPPVQEKGGKTEAQQRRNERANLVVCDALEKGAGAELGVFEAGGAAELGLVAGEAQQLARGQRAAHLLSEGQRQPGRHLCAAGKEQPLAKENTE
jgi:hypothetical protein